jgi:hypothetical protein
MDVVSQLGTVALNIDETRSFHREQMRSAKILASMKLVIKFWLEVV